MPRPEWPGHKFKVSTQRANATPTEMRCCQRYNKSWECPVARRPKSTTTGVRRVAPSTGRDFSRRLQDRGSKWCMTVRLTILGLRFYPHPQEITDPLVEKQARTAHTHFMTRARQVEEKFAAVGPADGALGPTHTGKADPTSYGGNLM